FANSLVGTPIEGHVVYVNDDFVLADVAWQFLSSFTLPEVSPSAESMLAGRTKAKIDGRRQPVSQVRWSFRVGAGTWGATTAAGTPLSGSWTPKRRNRRAGHVLPTTDSLAELSAPLAATAGDVTLEPVGSLGMRTDRSGAAVSLRGRFRVLRGGAQVGRYEIRLRRSRWAGASGEARLAAVRLGAGVRALA